MYKYVKHPLDTTYRDLLPNGASLTVEEVPAEELEMREAVSCWYEEAFDLYVTLKSVEIENKEELLKIQQGVLEHHNKILLLMLRRHEYQASLQRILSVWVLSEESKQHLQELLQLSIERRNGDIKFSS